MMTVSFDYSQVPSYFIHCFHAQCPLAGTCLRQWVACRVPAEVVSVQALNPVRWIGQEADTCPYFKPMNPVRVAWGMRKVLDAMPCKASKEATRWLNRYYPRMTLCRVMKQQRPIHPEEQPAIIAMFRTHGVPEEEVFDRIELRYRFD